MGAIHQVLLSGITAAGGGSSTLNTGIVSYWKMEESGNNNRVDSVGTNTFVPSGNAWTTGTGIIGTAAQANASSGAQMQVADNATLEPGAAWSLGMWVLLHSSFGGQTILSKWASNQSTFWFREAPTSGELRFFVANGLTDAGGNVGTTTDFGFSVDTFFHVVIVYDGSQSTNATKLKIYKDGVQKTFSFIGTIASSMTDGTAPLALGAQASANFLTGSSRIDEMGIWSKALTGSEVTELYNSGAGKQYPF